MNKEQKTDSVESRQAAAISLSHALAKTFLEDQQTSRNVGQEYLSGASLGEIAKKYIPEHYNQSRAVARQVIHLVLKATLNEEVRKVRLDSIYKENGGERGRHVRANRLGIFSPEFSFTPEQLRNRSEKAAAARGRALFSDEEIKFLLEQAGNEDNLYREGRYRGKTNLDLICRRFNDTFAPRSDEAIKTIVYKLRKKSRKV